MIETMNPVAATATHIADAGGLPATAVSASVPAAINSGANTSKIEYSTGSNLIQADREKSTEGNSANSELKENIVQEDMSAPVLAGGSGGAGGPRLLTL